MTPTSTFAPHASGSPSTTAVSSAPWFSSTARIDGSSRTGWNSPRTNCSPARGSRPRARTARSPSGPTTPTRPLTRYRGHRRAGARRRDPRPPRRLRRRRRHAAHVVGRGRSRPRGARRRQRRSPRSRSGSTSGRLGRGGRLARALGPRRPGQQSERIAGHGGRVLGVDPDGVDVISWASDGSVRLWTDDAIIFRGPAPARRALAREDGVLVISGATRRSRASTGGLDGAAPASRSRTRSAGRLRLWAPTWCRRPRSWARATSTGAARCRGRVCAPTGR